LIFANLGIEIENYYDAVVSLPFPHGTVDRSIVIFAFVGFVIAAEINPDEPSAVASCDDLANFASHRDFLLGSQGGTHLAHCMGSKAGFCQLIAKKTTVRP
jgi:hypothetical protein